MIAQNKIEQSCEYISNSYKEKPDTAIILGTGLNKVANSFQNQLSIPYDTIPNFKFSTAPSHEGLLIFTKTDNHNIAIMQGRLHLYEGYSSQDVVYPLFVLNNLGVKNLIITNAAGSLNRDLQTGDLALISDHINLTGRNPLIGKNNPDFGPRFPSLNNAYDKEFIKKALTISSDLKLKIKRGVYAGLMGPNMETRAECNMLKILGADLVGMSTVLEVVAANYLGIRVLGISAVTNLSNLFHNQSHQQADIERAALQSENTLIKLLKKFLKNI